MYLRPKSLFQTFLVETKCTAVDPKGRKVASFTWNGNVLVGVISEARSKELYRWRSIQHTITHTIVQKNGGPMAKEGDRLRFANRLFYVQGVDNSSALGLVTLYYVEERKDSIDSTG